MRIFKYTIPCLTAFSLSGLVSGQALKVDFSRTGGAVEAGFQGYFADHEVSSTFTTQTFTALGTSISLTPIWADDTVSPPVDGTSVALDGEPTAKQLILRTEATPQPDLYQDWIGLDGRGVPKAAANPLNFVLSGIPAGNYSLLSHHHDPQNQTGLIDITITDSNGSNTAADFDQSAGGGAEAIPAIYRTTFTSNGTDDIIISYSNQFAAAGTQSGGDDFTVINAIEIDVDNDSDRDGMPDSYEQVNGLNPAVNDAADDLDMDGLTNIQEYLGADGDAETADGTDPNDSDSDDDGLNDQEEVVTHLTDPNDPDSDGDFFNDQAEVLASTLPNDATSFPISTAGLLIDFSQDGANGPVHDAGYLPYIAADGVNGSVDRSETFSAPSLGAGAEVTLAIDFPNPETDASFPNTVKRMIGRTDGQAANYSGLDTNMIRDWIGFDARTVANGGGTDDPTQIRLSLTGLPAGKYLYISHHHDLGNVTGDFEFYLTDANNSNALVFSKSGTAAAGFDVMTGERADALPSTSNIIIESAGEATPVVIIYAGSEVLNTDGSVNGVESYFALNGLEIYPATDTDGDGMPDGFENGIAELNSSQVDSAGDVDNDNLSNLDEYYLNTLVNDDDTDNDDLKDGTEITPNGTDPFIADTDGDSLSDGREVNDLGSNPLLTDTDEDTFGDAWEALAGSNLNDASSVPDGDLDGYSVGVDPDDTDPAIFVQPLLNEFLIDFNSNQNGGGDSVGEDPQTSVANNNQSGYQSYHANHEVAEEFSTATYNAFGAIVTVTPSWPDSDNPLVQQSIGRGDGNNANWHGDRVNLLKDWLGIDTRVANGGGGDFDGTTGTPTTMLLTLGGLPGAQYSWTSFHHDTENVHAPFLAEISTDGGTTYTTIVGPTADSTFSMTDSTAGGTPASAVPYQGAENPGSLDPEDLPSTVTTTFVADGTNDVIFRFTPYSGVGVHRQIFGINGFEMVGPAGANGGLQVTEVTRNAAGDVVIQVLGGPFRDYSITKSLTLDNDFSPLDPVISLTTDSMGRATVTVPAAQAGEAKAFFRMEE
ncbi:hypothetical protein N9834_00065 [Akkermansiaceae bacterium]|nr:hypothetical protein [Akkermansiaceae bacterium]MDB4261785.1 hypothetical protein [Akkermansiaceae bacterium]MDB4309574.1 hypothetical protein [Akkermansiaceae bacterium]MDB4540731.1 hypothetical protein [Akkermansiaceae bacterium]